MFSIVHTSALMATQAVLDRRVVGPLTTTFVPPAKCSTPLMYGWDDVYQTPSGYGWGQGCNRQPDGFCFPSNLVDCSSCSASDTPLPVYTPAIGCPQGWMSACGASRIDETSASGAGHIVNWLDVGESIEVCCPSGWGCVFSGSARGPQGLVMSCLTSYTASSSTITGLSCDSNLGGSSALSITRFVVAEPTSSLFGSAHPIVLLTARSGVGGLQAVDATATSQPTTDLDGLITGAKVGIGIGAAVGFLLIVATVVLLWFIRIRRRVPEDQPTTDKNSVVFADKGTPYGSQSSEDGRAFLRAEIETRENAVELEQRQRPRRAELETNRPAELGEGRSLRKLELEASRSPVELEDTQTSAAPPTKPHLREARNMRV